VDRKGLAAGRAIVGGVGRLDRRELVVGMERGLEVVMPAHRPLAVAGDRRSD